VVPAWQRAAEAELEREADAVYDEWNAHYDGGLNVEI
jgi:hypothetical protein